MKLETFRQRLSKGKSSGYGYEVDGKIGFIAVWRYEDVFVLTWEEFSVGQFYNEENYTRDEVHHFATVDAVLQFLETNSVAPTWFKG
ncbi:MAG TPA: hypothetical protein VF600_18840 [Abditibacteriaceae bacterium]|jgi:hypothetical protein